MTANKHRAILPCFCCLLIILNKGSAMFTPPDFAVTCTSASTLTVDVTNCVVGSSVYVVFCTDVLEVCSTSSLTLTVDIVNDCDPDLDDNSDNTYDFRLVARQLNYFRPDTDYVFEGSCPGGTVVQNSTFPISDVISTVDTITGIFTPPVSITFTESSVPVTSSTVGDTLEMTVAIDEPYRTDLDLDISVDSCSANTIGLFTAGCPTGPLITNTFSVGGQAIRSVTFTSFMDPAQQSSLSFTCQVSICDTTCPTPVCSRKRRGLEENDDNKTSMVQWTASKSLTIQPKYMYTEIRSHEVSPLWTDSRNFTTIKAEQRFNSKRDRKLTGDAFIIATGVMILSLFVGVIGTLAYMKMSLSKFPTADFSTTELRVK